MVFAMSVRRCSSLILAHAFRNVLRICICLLFLASRHAVVQSNLYEILRGLSEKLRETIHVCIAQALKDVIGFVSIFIKGLRSQCRRLAS